MRIRCKTLLVLASPFVALFVIAYMQWAVVGLPALPPNPTVVPEAATEPHGFPAWLRITHYVNFLFMILLDPQRPADPRGSPPAVLERPLHARHGVAPAHADRGAEGPPLDGQG